MPVYKAKKLKDGRQQYRVYVSYVDRQGKYKKKTKIVCGANEAKLAELELMREVHETVPDAKITVNEVFKEYTNAKKHEVRATTLDKSVSILERDVLPIVGNVTLDKLNVKVMNSWKDKINDRDLSVTSKKNIYSQFRALLNFAVKREYIEVNPINKISNFKDVYFTKPQDKIQFYTSEQFKKYIGVAKNHCKTITDYGIYVFFNVAFYTGMRKGEINALKWTDIEGNIIHIRRSIAQKIKGQMLETPPKNKSSYRDVQIPNRLVNILTEHKTRLQAIDGFTDDWRVCGGINVLSDTHISNRNILYSKEAELPTIRIHDFRHSHASLLANSGINIQEVARRLGHSDIKMTWNTYAHLYPKEEERAIAVLDNC